MCDEKLLHEKKKNFGDFRTRRLYILYLLNVVIFQVKDPKYMKLRIKSCSIAKNFKFSSFAILYNSMFQELFLN